MTPPLLTVHSEKERAALTYTRGFGFRPLGAWVDQGTGGTGEPLAMLLRPGNAGSNTVADHTQMVGGALRQLFGHRPKTRRGRRVLVRADDGGCTHGSWNG